MLDIKCSDPIFRGLKDPYTGLDLDVRIVLGAGAPRVYAKGAFSPNKRFSTAEEAYLAVTRRSGIDGTIPAEDGVFCPYTGARMSPIHDDLGYGWTGGADPTLPVYTSSEFARLFTGGKVVIDRVSEADTTDPNLNVATPATDSGSMDLAFSEAESIVKEVVDGPKVTRTVVSVNGRRKRKEA